MFQTVTRKAAATARSHLRNGGIAAPAPLAPRYNRSSERAAASMAILEGVAGEIVMNVGESVIEPVVTTPVALCPFHMLFKPSKSIAHDATTEKFKSISTKAAPSPHELTQHLKTSKRAAVPRDIMPLRELIRGLATVLAGRAPELDALRIWSQSFARNGPRFALKLGKLNDVVHLKRVEDALALISREEKFPVRFGIPGWAEAVAYLGQNKGVFLANGPTWQRQRAEFKRHMLRPEATHSFPALFNPIVGELVEHLRDRAIADSSRVIEFADADALLHRFAFDCITQLFFGRRFFRYSVRGSDASATGQVETQKLSGVQTIEAQAFIDSVMHIFRGCLTFFYVPVGLSRALRTPRWKRFTRYFQTLFSFAEALVDEKATAVQTASASNSSSSASETGVVGRILADQLLTRGDVVASVVDIMGAAVDSTAVALQWALYLFARNPDKQAALREEVLRVMGASSESTIGSDQLQQMPYLKATVKEVLRLYPVIPLIGRVTQKPVEMEGGHNFATGTQFNVVTVAAGRSEEIFERADQFIPERWLRAKHETPTANGDLSVSSSPSASECTSNNTRSVCPVGFGSAATRAGTTGPEQDSINRYSSMAFGFGSRSCVGRRVAEAELYLMIANLVLRFRVLPPAGVAPADYRVDDKWQVLLLPKTPISVRLQLI